LKESYVSFVLPVGDQMISDSELLRIDQLLKRNSRSHEIVIVTPFKGSENKSHKGIELSGPLSIVYTSFNANKNRALIAGLARSVGDFIIEWHGAIESFTDDTFVSLLQPTNVGMELVEIENINTPFSSKIFYKVANSLRSPNVPVRKIVGRSYSRRALGHILKSVNFEPQLNILFAELALERKVLKEKIDLVIQESWRNRIIEGTTLLVKGSRFGSVVPLSLAAISALFGFSVSVYALVLYFSVGKGPEGWTTLMIVTGLGQASILALLGLTWSRIDSLARGLSNQVDATAEVVVIPPNL